MTRFLIRRLVQAVPVLLLISLLSFGLMHAAPGSFINPLDFPGELAEEDMQRILHNLGLDRPWYEQYGSWLLQLARLDLGYSYKFRAPVTGMIAERLPATLLLTATALALGLAFGVLIGVVAALRQRSLFDNASRLFAVAGHAVPTFWLGLVLIWFFGVFLGVLPTGGANAVDAADWDVASRLRHLVLPAAVLAVGTVANFSRFVRGEMLEVIRQDYVRTARAKGLTERLVLLRHALRNALIPVVTLLGISLRGLFGGAVLVETIFSWPGMGRLAVEAAFGRDYPVLMGTTLFSAVLVVAGNLLADLTYAWIDPRIRVE
jgi:peptide/nickel transport system permease protein